MAKPINHDAGSALGTAAWEAGKGGILGVIVTGLFFAGLAVLSGGVLGGIAGSIAPTALGYSFTQGAGAMLSGIGGWATIGIGIAGSTFGAIPAAIGAVFGLAKGGSRISAEKAAYREKVAETSHGREYAMATQINSTKIEEMQQAYMMGAQDTEARFANQLQAMSTQQQAAPAPAGAIVPATAGAMAMASAEAKCACGPHTQAVIDERQAAATAVGAGVTPTA